MKYFSFAHSSGLSFPLLGMILCPITFSATITSNFRRLFCRRYIHSSLQLQGSPYFGHSDFHQSGAFLHSVIQITPPTLPVLSSVFLNQPTLFQMHVFRCYSHFSSSQCHGNRF